MFLLEKWFREKTTKYQMLNQSVFHISQLLKMHLGHLILINFN